MGTQCAQLCLFWNALTCALFLWWFYQSLKGNVDVNFHPDQQSHLQQNALQLTDTWNSRQSVSIRHTMQDINSSFGVQELCESLGGRPGLPVLMSLMVSVDVKQHWTMLTHWSQFVPNMSAWHPRILSSTSSSSATADHFSRSLQQITSENSRCSGFLKSWGVETFTTT